MSDAYWSAYNNAWNAGQARGKATQDALDRQTARRAGNAFASGDYAGASNVFARSGDLANAEASLNYGQAQKTARIKEVTDAGLHALDALSTIPQEQRSAYFSQRIAPVLRQHGAPEDQITAWGSGPMDDGHIASEKALLGEAKAKLEPYTLGANQVRFDEHNRQVAAGPQEQDYTVIGEGAKAVPRYTFGAGPGNAAGGAPGAAASPGGTATAPPPAATPAPTGGVFAVIGQTAAQAGASPAEVGYLQRNAQIESRGKQTAVNGRSHGTFQFRPETFYSVLPHGDINSQADQTQAALLLQRRDRQTLQRAGVQPDDPNTYIMHQQGAGGGLALLTAPPEVGAVAALTPVYRGNANIARQAIIRNGGNADMTAGQFVNMWRAKWAGGRNAVASPVGPMAPVQTSGGGGYAPLANGHADPGGAQPGASQAQPGDPPGTIYGNPKAAQEGDTPLDEQSIKFQAGVYLATRTLPSLGQGKYSATDRRRIINEATRQATTLGITPNDVVAGTISIKAAGAALTQQEKTLEAVRASEGTVVANADLALSLAPKGAGTTGMPIFNAWQQHIRDQVFGSPDVSRFNGAIRTVAEEYAKVMTTNTGSGGAGTSDSARNEAYSRLSKSATPQQLADNIATMKQEMANRIASLTAVRDGIQAGIRAGYGAGGTASAAPGGPAAPAAAPAPPAQGPGNRPASPAHGGYTPQQKAALSSIAQSSRGQPSGSAANPYVPINEAEYNDLPSNSHYLHPDGRIKVKP